MQLLNVLLFSSVWIAIKDTLIKGRQRTSLICADRFWTRREPVHGGS